MRQYLAMLSEETLVAGSLLQQPRLPRRALRTFRRPIQEFSVRTSYMLDMGDAVKITELATRLIEMSGLRPGHDIEIKFVGTRPGEKLHEQLWTDATQVTPTSFPRILSVQPPSPADDFHHHLQSLEAAAFTREDEHVRKTMLGMPINYIPSEQQAAVVTVSHSIPARTLTMPTPMVPRPGAAASANA